MAFEFTRGTVAKKSRPAGVRKDAKPNEFLDVVKNFPVQDPTLMEHETIDFYIPLSGETQPIGAATKDGQPIPLEERKHEDKALVAVKRDLDSAGQACNVTVRKEYRLVALKPDGSENPRNGAKMTHALMQFYTTPAQKRVRKDKTITLPGTDAAVDAAATVA